VKNIPGEVDGKGGGDDTVEMQSVERQWIRMQAAKYLYENELDIKSTFDT
jgi:hypothetical protein